MTAVERLKQDSMYGLSAKKGGCCRAVSVVERFKEESMYGMDCPPKEVAVVERCSFICNLG